jgi:hypothetical protein
MQKQLRIVSRRHLAVCPFSSTGFPVTPHPLVFSRHLGRSRAFSRSHRTAFSGASICQTGGWLVWRYPSGRRMLALLPF